MTLQFECAKEDNYSRGEYVHLIKAVEGADDTTDAWVHQICSSPSCAGCERLRCLKMARKIGKHVSAFSDTNWNFVTMSSPNEFYLDKAFEVDNKAWNRLASDSTRSEKQIETYVGVREIKWTRKTGFNLHRHLLLRTTNRRWDWKAMHERWRLANRGIQCQFDVQPIDGGADAAVSYITKYITKQGDQLFWGGLSHQKVKSVTGILKGKRRSYTMRDTKVATTSDWYGCCFGVHSETCGREDLNGIVRID